MKEYKIYIEDNPELSVAYIYATEMEKGGVNWRFYINNVLIACIWKGKMRIGV